MDTAVLDGGGKDVAPAECSEVEVPSPTHSRPKEQSGHVSGDKKEDVHEKVSAQPSNSDDGGEIEASTESSEFKVPPLTLSRPKIQSKSVAEDKDEDVEKPDKPSSEEPTPALPYNEPTWSSTPSDPYVLTVIKNGTIIQTIQLSHKPFHVFGRLPSCDIQFEHPSISRYHAILQYRPLDKEDSGSNSSSHARSESAVSSSVTVNPKEEGFYVYDLGSTHGTFINKVKIQMRCFYRLRLGQMVKFGGSSRLFLLEVNRFLSPVS